MRGRRQNLDIFSLSFLDIISCGFGAVVLLVLISKTSEAPVADIEQQALAMLAQVLAAEDRLRVLEDEIASAEEEANSKESLLVQLSVKAREIIARRSGQQEHAETLAKDVAGLEAVKNSLMRLRQVNSLRRPSPIRNREVGGIPVDSDYVIFIIDTSGSMQEIWDRVSNELENVIKIHPKVRGFQVLNDNGAHILSAYKGKWIPDTPGRRKSIMKLFRMWNSASNSSPVEGLEVALKSYVNPNIKVSIYIFGDDYSGSSFDPVINSLVRLNTNKVTGARLARVHGVGFISNYSQGTFGTLMREVARRNDGTFIALPR